MSISGKLLNVVAFTRREANAQTIVSLQIEEFAYRVREVHLSLDDARKLLDYLNALLSGDQPTTRLSADRLDVELVNSG